MLSKVAKKSFSKASIVNLRCNHANNKHKTVKRYSNMLFNVNVFQAATHQNAPIRRLLPHLLITLLNVVTQVIQYFIAPEELDELNGRNAEFCTVYAVFRLVNCKEQQGTDNQSEKQK